jgi:hypothetical protein
MRRNIGTGSRFTPDFNMLRAPVEATPLSVRPSPVTPRPSPEAPMAVQRPSPVAVPRAIPADEVAHRAVPEAPSPVAPLPVQRPSPVAPRPVAPRPVAPSPVGGFGISTPSPVAPLPVQRPSPVAPRPVAPSPVAPRPVAPRPVAPSPVGGFGISTPSPVTPMFTPEAPMADAPEVIPYTPPTSVAGVIAELEAQKNPVPRISPQADFISELETETDSGPQMSPQTEFISDTFISDNPPMTRGGGDDTYVPPAPPYNPSATSGGGGDDTYVPEWPTPDLGVNIFDTNDTGDDIGEEVIGTDTVYEPPFIPPTLPVAPPPPVVSPQPEIPAPKTAVQLALEAGANRPKGPVRNFMPTAPANSGWTPGGWGLNPIYSNTTTSPGSTSGGSQ